jgi:predicted DNA-binding transcriptional regulator AlpA
MQLPAVRRITGGTKILGEVENERMNEVMTDTKTSPVDVRPPRPPTLLSEQQGLLLDELAFLHEKALVDEKRLAASLKVTPRTIRRMVARFELPPPIRLAGRSVWMVGHVLAHIQAAAERALSDAERQARRLHNLGP